MRVPVWKESTLSPLPDGGQSKPPRSWEGDTHCCFWLKFLYTCINMIKYTDIYPVLKTV